MDDADVLHDLLRWNEMGEPFVPEVSVLGEFSQASTNDARVADLLQTVADAVTEAQEKGLDANQVLNLVVIAADEYGRTAFGDDYLDNLCATLQRFSPHKLVTLSTSAFGGTADMAGPAAGLVCNIRIELAALANLSFAINGLRESMLRENKLQNGFHTAKTRS